MPIYLRKSTASQEVPLGHFVDDTDGKTAETGLTIANTDVKVWKTGATTLANKNSGGGTHISGGIYYAVLDATDTDTVGPLVLFVAVSGALAVRLECVVLDGTVYDVLFGSTAPSTFAGGAVASVTGNVGGNVTGSVGSVVGAVGSVTGAVGSVTGNVGGNVTGTVASVTGNVGGNVTGSVGSVATGGITSTSFAAGAIDAAAIATDAIASAELAASAVTEIVNAVWNEPQSGHTTAGTFGKYLDAQVSGASAPTAATVAAAVWDLSTSGHTTAGTFGQAVVAAGGAGDPWITPLPGSYTAGQAGYVVGHNLDATVNSRLATSGYTAPPSSATVAAAAAIAVWDQTTSGHTTTGTFGGIVPTLAGIGSDVNVVTIDPAAATDIADSVWASASRTLTAFAFNPTLTSSERNSIADALLDRNVAGGSSTGRTVKQALYLLRNKWSVSGTTLTVYSVDDTTSAWTATLTGDEAATPITASDPG